MNSRAHTVRGSVALTGATGFVGRSLLIKLTDRGWRVRALTRRPQPDMPGVTWISGDLADHTALARLVEKAAGIVHCAGLVKAQHPREFDAVNRGGVEAVLKAAHKHAGGGARFLLVSSLAARLAHLSPYAASKRAGEVHLQAYNGHLTWSVIRPPAIYGPGDREVRKLLNAARFGILPAPGSTRHRFALLHVDDLADLVCHMLQVDEAPFGQVLEVDDRAPGGYDYHDIADILENVTGRKVVALATPPALLRLAASVNAGLARWRERPAIFTPAKLDELLHPDWTLSTDFAEIPGWQPRIRAEEGLRRLVGERTEGR